MPLPEEFLKTMREGYTFAGPSLVLGAPLLNGECSTDTPVHIPLRTLNRHGLIAGATGTGKTKTLQTLAEQLSMAGVPVLLMDIKGDLSGIAAPGAANSHITSRHQRLGIAYAPEHIPVELLTLSDEPGARLRATVSEFGPVLLGRILDLNATQQSVLALVFKYCDDEGMPLLDLKDLRRVLQFVTQEGKAAIQKTYGSVSPATVNIILRKLIELEQQGAERFFGERSFDPQDLLAQREGRGVVHILRLTDLQSRPKLFSTFMLCLLAEIHHTFPEVGDPDKPRLCLFIDEAHLIFDTATPALLEQIGIIIKLIRSKGVGVFFCTQNPMDVPDDVLGQLGLKVQHALRAFTAKDRTTIKRTAENYPLSDFYRTGELLTSLGIGEALVTALSEKGTPTPLAHILMRAPATRMDVLTPAEIGDLVAHSAIAAKYNEVIDRESAFEMLEKRMKEAADAGVGEQPVKKRDAAPEQKEKSTLEELGDNPMVRQIGRTVANAAVRGLLGVLGLGTSSRRRKGRGLFG